MTDDDLRHHAPQGGVELYVRDDHAWVVVVGTVDAARASAAAELIDDQGAAATFDALRAGAAAWLDVTAPSVLGQCQGALSIGTRHEGGQAAVCQPAGTGTGGPT